MNFLANEIVFKYKIMYGTTQYSIAKQMFSIVHSSVIHN